MTEHEILDVAVVSKFQCSDCSWALVCINFTIIKNSENTNKKNRGVRNYILKHLAKREAMHKRIPLDQRQQGWPKKIENGSYFY